jgi:hypothetical protein
MVCDGHEKIRIQRGVPLSVDVEVFSDEDLKIPMDLTGKIVFISVKRLNDFSETDDNAVITSEIITHKDAANGITTWTLTEEKTLVPYGRYKADVRAYTNATEFVNSRTFYVCVCAAVTRRKD